VGRDERKIIFPTNRVRRTIVANLAAGARETNKPATKVANRRKGTDRRAEKHLATAAAKAGMAQFDMPESLFRQWTDPGFFGPVPATAIADAPTGLTNSYRGQLSDRAVAMFTWSVRVHAAEAGRAGIPVVRSGRTTFTTLAVHLPAPVQPFRSSPDTVAAAIHSGQVPASLTALHASWLTIASGDLVVHVPHRSKTPPELTPYLQQAIALTTVSAPGSAQANGAQSYAAPQYTAPQYTAPQYAQPQYVQPQYTAHQPPAPAPAPAPAPQYSAPQYVAPQPTTPQHRSPAPPSPQMAPQGFSRSYPAAPVSPVGSAPVNAASPISPSGYADSIGPIGPGGYVRAIGYAKVVYRAPQPAEPAAETNSEESLAAALEASYPLHAPAPRESQATQPAASTQVHQIDLATPAPAPRPAPSTPPAAPPTRAPDPGFSAQPAAATSYASPAPNPYAPTAFASPARQPGSAGQVAYGPPL
jgi:hypothetical protein